MRSKNSRHIIIYVATTKQQVLCCFHGGAGTGKLHVIKAVCQDLYRLLCTSGDENPDRCNILTVAQ